MLVGSIKIRGIGRPIAYNVDYLSEEHNHRLYRGSHFMTDSRLKIFLVLLLQISLLTLHVVNLIVNLFGHIIYVDSYGRLAKVTLRLHFDRIEYIIDVASWLIQVITFIIWFWTYQWCFILTWIMLTAFTISKEFVCSFYSREVILCFFIDHLLDR